ncbi:MAG TPA: hypothetical protein V6C96_03230 [Vampirovibrionales bacterium]
MINPDQLVNYRWYDSVDSDRSSRKLSNNIRYENKILLEATNQSINYTTQRSKVGSSFESLFRSLGLGVGVVLGGPIGAATLSSIAGGIGRGVGEHLGNKIYGKTVYDLEQIISNHKYKQLLNYWAKSQADASVKLTDEFYNQSQQQDQQAIQDINIGLSGQ